ncbi:MAG: glycosyltransferase family 4 protein [Fibrobacteres bacterium]|nr:glycosyltransferase family 4 protein [Fibrobacterota bacterium]
MKNIIQVIDTSLRGGAELHMLQLCKTLERAGNRIVVICPDGDMLPLFKSICGENISLHVIDPRDGLLKYLFFIRKICKTNNTEIIHSHQHLSGLLCKLSTLFTKIKHVLTVHTVFTNIKTRPLIKLRTWLIFASAYLLVDRVYVLSNHVKTQLQRIFYLPDNKTKIVFNCIEPNNLLQNKTVIDALKSKYNPSNEYKIILCAGLFDEGKGHAILIRAFKKLQHYGNCYLILLGDGEKRSEYQTLSKKLGLTNIFFMPGYVDNIADWFGIADCYIQPSLRDNMPTTILEAMFLHVPVIASDLGSFKEIIDNDINGLLFKAGDSEQLAKLLERCLYEQNSCTNFANGAYEKVTKRFTFDTLQSTLLQDWESL